MTKRAIEFIISVYFAYSGLLFLAIPTMLQAPVYELWQSFGQRSWGVIMLGVAMLHWLALWYNGRDRVISLLARSFACCLHLAVSLSFGLFFILGGATWGTGLYWWLIPAFLFPITVDVWRDWIRVIKGEEDRHAGIG